MILMSPNYRPSASRLTTVAMTVIDLSRYWPFAEGVVVRGRGTAQK